MRQRERLYQTVLVIITLMLLCCAGCAFVNVPLLSPSLSDFEEQTVLGKGDNKILLLDVSGVISEKDQTNRLGMTTDVSPVARIREELEKAREDRKIKALLLKIDSPGGTVTASDIIYHELQAFKKETGIPVIVSMMDVAASGGYYIAMAADKIIAHPTSITGSIGVLTMKFDIQGLMAKVGVEEVTVKSGDMKDFNSIFHTLRPEDQALLQGIIDALYVRFTTIVAESRPGLSLEEVKKAADGRVYTARQALELKLIDEIGYLEDGIELAKKAAGISQARVIAYQRPSQPKKTIYAHSAAAGSPLISSLGSLENLSCGFWYLWMP